MGTEWLEPNPMFSDVVDIHVHRISRRGNKHLSYGATYTEMITHKRLNTIIY